MHSSFRLVTLTALVAALTAHAEKAPVNIHLDVGGGTGLDRAVPLTGATLKVDTTLLKALGPLAPQVELFGKSSFNNFLGYLDQGAAFGVGLGARLRLFNDEKGYLFNPGTKHRGNLWGSWYFDAHFLYAAARNAADLGFGFDIGTGYEFSLVEALHIGPVVTFRLMGPHQVLMAGLSISIGAPDTIPAEADFDDDGIAGEADKCPDQAGPKENGGCPDTDKDGDGTVDRLDACVDVAGEKDNKGCPYPDADKDGVNDRVDNCLNEAGPASNQGCPEKVKQLVVITREKLIIKDKVYFDTGKATIQARSNTLLDQISAIMASHDEIKFIQVEGHTDNSGVPEKNLTLSQDRANSVKAYLVKKGVADTRLKSVGFGQEKPADTNDTPAGRDNNRRVEFNIIAQ
jgi:outer membrane protein OmpA-like peptidoglycan-associated protein